MNHNPYEPPEIPAGRGKRFPWQRLLVSSTILWVVCLVVGIGLRPIGDQSGGWDVLRRILIVGFLLGFVVMVISYLGKRRSELFPS